MFLKNSGRVIVSLCVLIFSSTIFAFEVETKLSSAKVFQNEPAKLEVVITGAKQARPLELPEVAGLDIQYGGITHTTRVDNFKMWKGIILTLYLTSEKPGTYAVPSFRMSIDGKEVLSRAVSLTVQKGQARRRRNFIDPFEEFFGSNARRRKVPTYHIEVEKSISKEVFYAGEVAILRYYILADETFSAEVENASRIVQDGLVIDNIEEQIPYKSVTVDGAERTKYHALSYSLVGIKSGKYTIANDSINVIFESGDSVISFPVRRRLNFPAKEIAILPLPDEGKPEQFSGSVGEFSYRLSPAKSIELKTGEERELVIELVGKGNFNSLKEPDFDAVDGLSLIKQSETPDISLVENEYKGSVRYSYSLIAEKEGNYELATSLNWFNPYTERYESDKLKLSVAVSSGSAALFDDELDEVETDAGSNVSLLFILIAAFLVIGAITYFSISFFKEQGKQRKAEEMLSKQAAAEKRRQRKSKRKISERSPKEVDAKKGGALDMNGLSHLYCEKLSKAARTQDAELLTREIKTAIGFLLRETKLGEQDERSLKEIRSYIERSQYGGGSIELSLLLSIRKQLDTILKSV